MPVFHRPESQPDIAYANLDQIRIKINRAYDFRFSSLSDYNNFKRDLGRTPLFSVGHAAQSSTFTVRGGGNLGERWLFGGTLTFKRENSRPDFSFTGQLNLELNPTRYINHAIHEAGGPGGIEDPENFIAVYMAQSRPHESLERCLHLPDNAWGLDRNDNLIPHRLYRHMRPALDIFDIYFSKVLQLVREQVETTLAETVEPARYQFQETLQQWSFPRLETYWEFSVSNAVAFLNGLHGHIVPMVRNVSIAHYVLNRGSTYDGPDMEAQVVRNAPGIKLDLGVDGIELLIYAKTLDRVRFEVRYKKNVRKLICGRVSAGSLPPLETGVRALVQLSIEDAHSRMRRLFQRMPDLDFSERCDFQIFVEFLADLAEACRAAGKAQDMQRIISLLASNGSIEVPVDSTDHRICQHLAQQDILREPGGIRNARGSRQFCLNPRYSNSLSFMILSFSNQA